ncbi:MAG: hypothetical protein ACYS29_08590, partial [Planctomycetota bacterium]
TSCYEKQDSFAGGKTNPIRPNFDKSVDNTAGAGAQKRAMRGFVAPTPTRRPRIEEVPNSLSLSILSLLQCSDA